MLTPCHKFTVFVLELNDHFGPEETKQALEDGKYPEFVKAIHEETVDIGEWDDDHILNKIKSGKREYNRFFMTQEDDCPHCNGELLWKVVGDFADVEVGHMICTCGFAKPFVQKKKR